MTTTQSISRDAVANDFRNAMQGKMAAAQLDAATSAIAATSTAYPADGSVASAIFFLKFKVTITGGKSFDGNAGGVSIPGGGALFGDVYTDDINALYSNTHSFQFNATAAYLNINFFDGNGNFLGSYQAGAVSTVLGTGGGRGSWS